MSTYPDDNEQQGASVSTGVAPPHSIEAEQAVLGAILLSDKLLYSVVIEIGLRANDFYRERHAVIFQAMLDLYGESEPIDVLTVTDRLRGTGKLEEIGGSAVVDELAGPVPVVGNLRRYGQIVREQARMRRLLTSTYEIQASVLERTGTPDELIEWAERSILEVAHDDETKDFSTVGAVLDREVEIWSKLSREGVTMTGTTSGFRDLDEITGGFQPGNLIVIAARPSMGKSALVTNMAENVSLNKTDPRPVVLFSLEMAEAELAQRFVASEAMIEGDKIRKGKLKNEADFKRVVDAANRFHDAPLFIDDSSDIGTLEIRAKARRLHQQHGQLGLIIVDYLQLMRPDGRVENRVQQVGEMSRGLKILARELQVPVIALSQLSRGVESRTDKRPLLSDLRECVTGDTLVQLADGRRVPIRDLVGSTPEVLAVDEHDRVVTAGSDKVWPVGVRPVFDVRLASGRRIRATSEHRIRTGAGWSKVRDFRRGTHVAVVPETPAILGADRLYQRSSHDPAESTSAGVLVEAPSRTTSLRTDLFWDRVVSVEPAGEEMVYDLTVPGPSCWLADGIVTHNSGQIEQDADLVMFIYRDEYYNPDDTEFPGEAELIIGKHRNGGLGTVNLVFQGKYPKFMSKGHG